MKVCVVGAGSIGNRHIKNLKKISEEQEVSIEIHLLRSTHRALDAEIQNIISNQFFSKDDVDDYYDAVFVTNPTFLHYQTILELKSKTKCFFVEKPVFDNWEIDLSQLNENEVTYYVACPLRYTKILRRAKEIIAGKKVLSVRAICSSFLPDWRPGIDYRNTYSAHKNQGGGVMIDLIHEWDYLTYLFGFPEQVMQMHGKYSELEIDSEDIAIYIAKYKDKLIELHLDYFGKETQRYCEVITTEDVYMFDITNGRIQKNGQVIEKYSEEVNDKYLEELSFFYDIIRGKTENTNGITRAIDTMRIACCELE